MTTGKELDLFNNELVIKETKEDDYIVPHTIDIIQDVVELLLAGKSRHEIAEAMPYDDATIKSIIDKAETEITAHSVFDVDSIIADHVAKYEKLYFYAMEKGYTDGRLRSMKQKENILAIHNEVNEVRIINETQEIIDNREDHDFNKLSIEEKSRLLELLAKIKQ